MKDVYRAQPCSPGEHADPALNPEGGRLGWIIVTVSDDVAVPIVGGYRYMTQGEAQLYAAIWNASERYDSAAIAHSVKMPVARVTYICNLLPKEN